MRCSFLIALLKNRIVYLVDSSSLTSSPLGRELSMLLLFPIVTPIRVDSFAVNVSRWCKWFSLQIIQRIALLWNLTDLSVVIVVWTFILKYNIYAEKCTNHKYTAQWIITNETNPDEETEHYQPPSNPLCVPFWLSPSTNKGTIVLTFNIID